MIKKSIRKLMPLWLLNAYRKARYGRTWLDDGERGLAETFRSIYKENHWGEVDGAFYSGPGSDEEYSVPYAEALLALIDEIDAGSMVDVGCGDFRVGHRLAERVRYHGIDIVPELIAHNRTQFGSDAVAFSCLDVTKSRLPTADFCTVRQVLQHLSNEQVMRALQNCRDYPWVVITEHVAADAEAQPNQDIVHGVGTRADVGSGLVFSAVPFSIAVERTLCSCELANGSRIDTVLIRGEAIREAARAWRVGPL